MNRIVARTRRRAQAAWRRIDAICVERPRARRWLGGGFLVAGLIVLVLTWAGWKLLTVRNQLLTAKTQISDARAMANDGHLDDATELLRHLRSHTRTAVSAANDPLLRGAAHLPLFGSSFTEIRTVARTVDDLAAQALPDALAATDDLHGSSLRLPGDQKGVNLDKVRDAATRLDRVVGKVAASTATLQATPSSTALPGLSSARHELLGQIADLSDELDRLDRISRLAPAMLGADGPRTYFLALENSAESRGAGGIVGAYGIVRVDHGRIDITDKGGDAKLVDPGKHVVHVSPEYDDHGWGAYDCERGTKDPCYSDIWRDATFSPHFPDVVSVLAQLYANANPGQHLDGVLALDPAAAGAIVKATKPLVLGDGTTLQGDDVARYMETGIYEKYPGGLESERLERQKLVSDLEEGVIDAALKNDSPGSLLSVLGNAAGAGHLRFGSTHADEEDVLSGLAIGGAIPDTAGPFLGVAFQNGAGDKLDAFLKSDITWKAGACGSPTREVTATVQLTNTAPASGLPEYVNGGATATGRLPNGTYLFRHNDPNALPPYQDRLTVGIYGSVGASVTSASDSIITHPLYSSQKHPFVLGFTVLPPAGGTSTFTVTWTEPSAGPVHHPVITPLPIDPVVHIDVPAC
ncbi:MAG TPA: DUF4012 domain-containing protein [Mycobacteriales bacterium]|nr:DUF4012 domain-containing protein [Mycobacteriales bacterium]